ncbi:MAG: DUF692 domain-containing protein [Sandaracinaceae bacterium]|nr:DUF692 domain-containing protein [Sandaracinaceae bacterium]
MTESPSRPQRSPGRPKGVGLGLRHELAKELFETRPREVAWVEIHPENYVGRGGTFAAMLEEARDRYDVVTHGLTQCVGSPDPLDLAYVARLKTLLRDNRATWHSEHLAWCNLGGRFSHDLLPMPFTRASVRRAAETIRELRDRLEIEIAIENASYYGHPGEPEMSEIEFLEEVLDAADCKILLDVNNVWVNAQNHRFDPAAFLSRVPAERVVQLHVAGHFIRPDGLIIDTHAEPVCDGVYDMLDHTLHHVGDVPILLERDGNYPALAVVLDELRRLEAVRARVLEQRRLTPALEVRA